MFRIVTLESKTAQEEDAHAPLLFFCQPLVTDNPHAYIYKDARNARYRAVERVMRMKLIHSLLLMGVIGIGATWGVSSEETATSQVSTHWQELGHSNLE